MVDSNSAQGGQHFTLSTLSALSTLSTTHVAANSIVRAANLGESSHPQAWPKSLFRFAREIKAHDNDADDVRPYKPLIRQWGSIAPSAAGVPFEDVWGEFVVAWPKINGPGQALVALRRADSMARTVTALQYDADATQRLVGWMRELQRETGSEPFFLSCDQIATLLNIHSMTAWRRMKALENDGVIATADAGVRREKGKRARATRYRYIANN